MATRKAKQDDLNQIAARIVAESTAERYRMEQNRADAQKEIKRAFDNQPEKNPAAVALGRLGGLKGGKARAAKLTAKQRKEMASNAAKSRWKKL